MRTQKITLLYQITQEEIIEPSQVEIERKNRWIKEAQKTVEAPYRPQIIKVEYSLFNPEIENQRRFFNGAVVAYYAIQNENLLTGYPDIKTLQKYRETILDEVLGFDVTLVSKTVRRRKSTSDFKSVQAWSKFLNTVEETIFDSAGYLFPLSEDFWELVKGFGYIQSKKISVENLQKLLKAKNKSV